MSVTRFQVGWMSENLHACALHENSKLTQMRRTGFIPFIGYHHVLMILLATGIVVSCMKNSLLLFSRFEALIDIFVPQQSCSQAALPLTASAMSISFPSHTTTPPLHPQKPTLRKSIQTSRRHSIMSRVRATGLF